MNGILKSGAALLITFFQLPILNSQPASYVRPLAFDIQSLTTEPKYEFRAVWIATVMNIDWPSSKNLSSEEQKQEFISILDRQQQLGMNAVIVQVRPSADAFYPSKYEP